MVGTEEQKAVRGMSAYSSMSFEEAIDMELAELAAIGIKVYCYHRFLNLMLL